MEHKEYRSINKSVRKKDSMQLLLGKPVYTGDVTPDDALVVKILRSPHANAIVETIDTALAKKVITDVISADERVIKDPAPFVRVWNLNTYSVDIMVRVWSDVGDYWELRSALLEQIKIALCDANITIPVNPVTLIQSGKEGK